MALDTSQYYSVGTYNHSGGVFQINGHSSSIYLVVENCLFENNTAKRGSAYMLAGIDHGLDGIPEGHYNSIINSTFKNNVGTEEGGAVHITGNNNKAINCTFLDNYATEGNGSAIYVHGNNSLFIL